MSEINLNRFSGFIKPKESEQKGLAQPEKKRIIGYTRVSSKRQIEGYSIDVQRLTAMSLSMFLVASTRVLKVTSHERSLQRCTTR